MPVCLPFMNKRTLLNFDACCRRYCSQEPDWQDAILLLDEFGSSGWDLIASLAAGEKSAGDLLFNPFISN